MALLVPSLINGVSTDASVLRQLTQILAGGASGVAGSSDLNVTTSAGMVSVIAAGKGLIAGTQNLVTQGEYGVVNDAPISQTHAAADATNPRNDLVGIKIEDAFYSGVNKQATAVIVTGTPALSPADPATPPNWLPLARVRVNAGASSLTTITDLRSLFFVGAVGKFADVALSSGTSQNINVPANVNNIELQIKVKAAATPPNILIRFNNDAANNYAHQRLNGQGTVVSAQTANPYSGVIVGEYNSTTYATQVVVKILDILNTATHKEVSSQETRVDSLAGIFTQIGAGVWNSTAAITSIQVVLDASTFAAGTTIRGYGSI